MNHKNTLTKRDLRALRNLSGGRGLFILNLSCIPFVLTLFLLAYLEICSANEWAGQADMTLKELFSYSIYGAQKINLNQLYSGWFIGALDLLRSAFFAIFYGFLYAFICYSLNWRVGTSKRLLAYIDATGALPDE